MTAMVISLAHIETSAAFNVIQRLSPYPKFHDVSYFVAICYPIITFLVFFTVVSFACSAQCIVAERNKSSRYYIKSMMTNIIISPISIFVIAFMNNETIRLIDRIEKKAGQQ